MDRGLASPWIAKRELHPSSGSAGAPGTGPLSAQFDRGTGTGAQPHPKSAGRSQYQAFFGRIRHQRDVGSAHHSRPYRRKGRSGGPCPARQRAAETKNGRAPARIERSIPVRSFFGDLNKKALLVM